MKFYEQGRKNGDFEYAASACALAVDAGQPAFLFRLEQRAGDAARRASRYRMSDQDLASRLSFFLWGTAPDAELLKAARRRLAAHAGRPREAGARACSPIARAEALSTRFARAVAAAAGPRQDSPGRAAVSAVRRHARAVDEQRDRAVLRQHRPRGSQRARSADRRLQLRQRAAREALRHPERHRQRRSSACSCRDEPPRPARPGQRPDADVGSRPHLAGAARQVGPRGDARHRRRRRRRRTCRRSTTPRRWPAARC